MSRFNKAKLHTTKTNFGPLKWMAPEALVQEYVKKTDVWSYGVTLIEMLTKGGDPYPGENPIDVACSVRDDGRVPVVPPSAPPELESLMKDCWKQKSDARPDFEEIVTRLKQFTFKLENEKRAVVL